MKYRGRHNLRVKTLMSQAGELEKQSDDIENENKGLAANSDALGGEEKNC